MSSKKPIAKSDVPSSLHGTTDKPALPRFLFWDYRYDEIQWRDKEESLIVINRVLDRGNDEDLDELIRFYGKEAIFQVLIHEPIYLMDHSIEHVCTYFCLKKEDLHCYHWKRTRPGHWI